MVEVASASAFQRNGLEFLTILLGILRKIWNFLFCLFYPKLKSRKRKEQDNTKPVYSFTKMTNQHMKSFGVCVTVWICRSGFHNHSTQKKNPLAFTSFCLDMKLRGMGLG